MNASQQFSPSSLNAIVPSRQLILSTGSTQKPFCNIYCDRLNQNISINGRHTAIALLIEGQELVFDNIHPQGISRVEWTNSFYSAIQDLGQDFTVLVTDNRWDRYTVEYYQRVYSLLERLAQSESASDAAVESAIQQTEQASLTLLQSGVVTDEDIENQTASAN